MTTVDLVVCGLAEDGLTIQEALDRAGTLKSELVEYGLSRRWAREREIASEETFGRHGDPDENQWIAFLDHFLLQRRLPDGRTVLQRFVATRGDLPRAEREMLLGWGDVVEGVFEVEDRIGDLLLTTNVIDELAYTIGATAGPTAFAPVPVPGIMVTRVVRVGPVWAVSGPTAAFDLTQRQTIYSAAAERAMRKPELCFRNPAKLLLAREIEQVHRSVFLEHFGGDLVVLAGAEFEQRMNDYWRACQARAGSSVSAEGEPTEPARIADDYGLAESQTVAAIYDEQEGLSFYPEFGRLAAVFADPHLLVEQRNRDLVLDYLHDPGVSAMPLRRLATADPQRASTVFARVLGRSGFRWDRDGEHLLGRAKSGTAIGPALPRLAPLGPRLTDHLQR